MPSAYLELFVEQGETFSIDVSLDSPNGEPYDLSNFTVKSEIRKSYWSANTTDSFNASVVGAGEEGMITLNLDAEATQNIASGRYVYDVFLTNVSSNARTKVLEGVLFVDPSSTRI